MGIVPNAGRRFALSRHVFPLFDLNRERTSPGFLGVALQYRNISLTNWVQHASEGTTNRIRLQEDRFLALEIPLPPLQEQRRIVARIEELSSLIDEARVLRQESVEQAGSLWPSILQIKLSGVGILDETTTRQNARDMLLSSAKMFSGSTLPNHNNAHPHEPAAIQ